MATTFDGHPMAKAGRAGEALTAAFTSSFVGALIAVIVITFLAPLVAKFSLRFGPPGILRRTVASTLCSFVGLGKGHPAKTIAAMMLGFALAAVGLDTVTGTLRMTFGTHELLRGFDFLIAVIGLFGIGEILQTMEEGLAFKGVHARINPRRLANLEATAAILADGLAQHADRLLDGHYPGRRDAGVVHELRHRQAFFQGWRKIRHRPDGRRGRAGNRGARRRHQRAAADADARHPGLADRGGAARRPADLGPATRAAAVHRTEGLVWGLIASMYLGNIVGLIIVLTTVPWWAAILRVPFSIIAPIIIVVCAIGAYTVHNAMLDVALMLVFGVVGYLFKKLDYPLAPLVLALVLGDMAESSFRQSMLLSRGEVSIFWSNGLVGSICGLAMLMLFWPVITQLLHKLRSGNNDLNGQRPVE